MKIELNPAKWFQAKAGDAATSPAAAAVVEAAPVREISTSAKAVENVMATTAVVTLAHKNGFVRFIDAIGHFLVRAEPVALKVAVAAEPFLAFTPFGPEWDLAVNAIVGVQKNATASIAAGVNLTNEQKFALAVQAAGPGLNAILASKNVSQDTQTHVTNWVQLVFNLLSGPVIGEVVSAVNTQPGA